MASFNKVILAGNLTRDPEIRYTAGGLAVAKLGLAVNRKWKDGKSGETKEEVAFVDVDAFGKQAETIGQWLKKGAGILIEGRLKTETWDDKEGKKRSRLAVVLEGFTFLGDRNPEPAPRTVESRNEPKTEHLSLPKGKPAEMAEVAAWEKDDVPF